MAKIAIDARFLGPEGTGLGKYTEKLLENLGQIDQDNEYFVILRPSNFPLFSPKNNNFHKVKIDVRWYTLKEQFVIPWRLRDLNIDLLHVPHFNAPVIWNKKLVLTIHDLIKSNFKGKEASTLPSPLYWLKQLAYEYVLKTNLRKAAHILTPSQFTANSLAASGVDKRKVSVTYEASDDYFAQSGEVTPVIANSLLERYGIKKPYLLYVGNTYPYKNLQIVLKALKLLPEEITLVNVSARSHFTDSLVEAASHLGVSSRVVVTGFVPNEELYVLHKNSLAYVFPSLSEGFGIPGLDAMSLGEPLISSSASCLPEVYGEGALYFDPRREADLADQVIKIKTDEKLKNELVDKGKNRAKEFSWRKMAEQTLAVYRGVLSQSTASK